MKIRVTIIDDHECTLHDAILPVSEMLTRECCQMLDFPSSDCDRTTEAIFCTPKPIRDHVTTQRKVIAEAITSDLMRFFESKDSEMGYPKN